MNTEITKEAFNSIVKNEQQSFKYNKVHELCEETHFFAMGVNLFTIFNFISNTKQYYIIDINA